MQTKQKKQDPYKELANFYNKKRKEPAGGKFFTIMHKKAPQENGVWARSKHELETHLNKIRKHFTRIVEEPVV